MQVKVEEKTRFIEQAVDWARKKGFQNIRARLESLDSPSSFLKQSTNERIIPDATALDRDSKHYLEIALKTDSKQMQAGKWKFLATMASRKNGKLFLFAPHGHKAFAQRMVSQYQINAEVLSL